MAEIKDLLFYLLQQYPNKYELSNARVTKMVYLCDWKHSIDFGCQITNIIWYFDSFGPFVWDVVDTAKQHLELFEVESSFTPSGNPKVLINAKQVNYSPILAESEKKVADHVVQSTKIKTWEEFINLVYSTYPILTAERFHYLNLPEIANEYKKSPFYHRDAQAEI
ncbi:MAG: Panacea domain-containing protein [Acidobacteriota bacterium]|nr:Panacea domain-containing protein [Acidobacteriota bacterium]